MVKRRRGYQDPKVGLASLKSKLETLAGRYGDCHPWMGNISASGYPRIVSHGRLFYAHRLIRSLADGVPYEDMHVHHRCHNRACVRLEHLQAVTPADHAVIHAAEETTCKRGHTLADAYIRRDTWTRQCRTCIRLRSVKLAEARAVEAALRRIPIKPRACAVCGSEFTPARNRRATACSSKCRSRRFQLNAQANRLELWK